MSRAHTDRPIAQPSCAHLHAALALVVVCALACGTTRSSQTTLATQSHANDPTRLHTNQLGYLPALSKCATLQSDATSPVAWSLLDARGQTVLSGQTEVRGFDAASGEHVHSIDFTNARKPASSYRLRAAGQESHPFAIQKDVLHKLRWDALAFFYHQRSGIEITLPFAGEPRWTRPAGHLSDRSVGCADAACDYTLDVSGGWYDAGDHGKYVVNGGITVWTLLNLYERSEATRAAFADGTQNIPERDNGTSDLLDEVRWELEFLLRMQVPEGHALAGMVHHKIHDVAWTPLPTAPDEDHMPRFLRPPSTAATLNLAAVAAQAARIYRDIDPAFSARCLDAARRAYTAAADNPARYAPETDANGGGAYADTQLDDERYWAAAELSITTGEEAYRAQLTAAAIEASFFADGAGDKPPTALGWKDVAGAGTISLALAAPDALSELRQQARDVIRRAADALVTLQARQGYGMPYAGEDDGAYPWGSNALVLNNALVLAVAFQLGGDSAHLDAVVAAMDYILGDNPLDQSYVTGHGARPLHNPHHRFFAHELDPERPSAPPGFVSGGPNSGLQDPVAQAELSGCAPARCFVDDIQSYATNEVAINWNAPLAWLATFLDEQGAAP